MYYPNAQQITDLIPTLFDAQDRAQALTVLFRGMTPHSEDARITAFHKSKGWELDPYIVGVHTLINRAIERAVTLDEISLLATPAVKVRVFLYKDTPCPDAGIGYLRGIIRERVRVISPPDEEPAPPAPVRVYDGPPVPDIPF